MVAYKLVPHMDMEYVDKLDDHHKARLEETYKEYKEKVEKFNETSFLYTLYKGRIDGIETAMRLLGYEFVEETEKQ
jgi:hypothetical protein